MCAHFTTEQTEVWSSSETNNAFEPNNKPWNAKDASFLWTDMLPEIQKSQARARARASSPPVAHTSGWMWAFSLEEAEERSGR